MNEGYARQVLRVVLGRVCQPLGVHGMQTSVCETMTDVLGSYLLSLGRVTATYCAHANRTEPNLSDVAQAFRNLDVNLSDLSEFMREVDSLPLEQVIPRFPIPRKSSHIYQGPASYGEMGKKRSRAPSLSSEDEESDHIPPYLPPFPSQVTDTDKDDDAHGVSMEIGEATTISSLKGDEIAAPTPMDPLRGLPQLFRPRGFSSDFSEDGDANGSRRNSVSDGAVMATPVQASTPTLPAVNELDVAAAAEVALTGTKGTGAGGSCRSSVEPAGKDDQVSDSARTTSEAAVLVQAGNESTPDTPPGSDDEMEVEFPATVLEVLPGGAHGETSTAEGEEKLAAGLEASVRGGVPQLLSAASVGSPAATAAEESAQQPALPVLKPPTNTAERHHPLLPPPLKLMSPTSSSSLSSEHPDLSPILHSPNGRSLPLSPVSRGSTPKFGTGNMPILSPLHGPIKPVFSTPDSHPVPPQSVVPIKCESSMSLLPISTQLANAPSTTLSSLSLMMHTSAEDHTHFVAAAPVKSLSSSSSSSSSSGSICAVSRKTMVLEFDEQSSTRKSPVPEYAGDFSEEGAPSGGDEEVIGARSGESRSCLSPSSLDDVKEGSKSPLGPEDVIESVSPLKPPRPCLSSTSSEVSSSSVHENMTGEKTLLSGSEDGMEEKTLLSGSEDGMEEKTLLSGSEDGMEEKTLLSASEDGMEEKTLLSGSEDGMEEKTLLSGSEDGTGEKTLLSASEDGMGEKTLLSASEDGMEEKALLSGSEDGTGERTGEKTLLSASEDGTGEKTLLSASEDGMEEKTLLSASEDGTGEKTLLSASEDGMEEKTLLSGSEDGKTLLSASEVLDDDEELDIPLEISSSEGDEKEVFGFEQDLLPERLSLSPMRPVLATPTSKVGVSTGSDVVLPATSQDSNVGVSSEEAMLSSKRASFGSEDDYDEADDDDDGGDGSVDDVQVSGLGGTIKKTCSDSVEREFYSAPSSSSVSSLPVPVVSNTKSLASSASVPARLEDKKKLLSSSLPSHGLKASFFGNRTPPPPPGSRGAVALPCSPLVVHVKRHMVPSLRATGGKEEKEEAEEVEAEEDEEEGEELVGTHFKTKAEMKAELFPMTTTYAAGHRPHTPSSSPTPSPSPAPLHPLKSLEVAKITPLKVSIKRHILRSPSLMVQQTTPTLSTSTPSSETLLSASRTKKPYALFGRSIATSSPAPVVHGQSTVASQRVASALQVNPRKRELDASELGLLPVAPSKRFRHEPRVEPPVVAASSSTSSSSSEEDDGEGESESNSLSITPSPSSATPPPAPGRFQVRPRTPSCIDDEEEESVTRSVGMGSLSMGTLKLAIKKTLLPPVTVKHLGGVAEKGARRGRKLHKPQKIPPAEIPALTICSSNLVEVCGSRGRGMGVGRGGGAIGKRRSGASRGLQRELPLAQTSDTICPECGLKDDGSPMIGCDHCDTWVHWVCCGVSQAPPEDQKWYCADCKKSGMGATPFGGKKRGRKRKKPQ